MTVERTVETLRMLRNGCAVWPQNRRKAIDNAIAIIKAAQEWRQIKLEHIKDPIGTTWEMQHAEDVLLSLISPEQAQKKKEEA